MCTISLCMIVKNEESVLARCLDSVRGIADEIILVDTGSTDATKDVAAAIPTRYSILSGWTISRPPATSRSATPAWITACGWTQTT